MPTTMRAMAPRPPTTPPTMGPMGVLLSSGAGVGVGVVEEVDEVEVEMGVEEKEEVVETMTVEVRRVDVELTLGVYQIWPVPAATAQPMRL